STSTTSNAWARHTRHEQQLPSLNLCPPRFAFTVQQHHHRALTMSSHFSRLREELDARQSELHEKEATVESIKKLTQELEAQKRALVVKSAELDDRQKEVKRMQTRLDALVAAEPAIASAMSTKSSTTDVVRHVVECAIRSDHLTGSDIVRLALGVAMQVNGRTRGDNIDDILIDLIDDEQGLKAAIESAMANFAGVKDVVKCALDTALEHGASDEDLTEVVAKMVFDMLGNKASPKPIKETPIAVNLPKENAPPGGQTQAAAGIKNGLRGQAKDFKPQNDQNGSYNSKGWEAFARENGAGNASSKEWVFYGRTDLGSSTGKGW
ncbi:hypothetical protein F5883DRAFT_671081, partial [Diaporthe sp. PMI_573]